MLRKTSALKESAFTLLELLFVIAVIAILAALLLPALESARARSKQTQCLSQLKQIGVAYHMYAHEHPSAGDFEVSTNSTANWESWGRGEDLFRRFQLFSNELSSPAVLRCPSDKERTRIDSFANLRNENISYTLCLYTFLLGDSEKPVSSDRNIEMDTFFVGGPVHWTAELHEKKGNVLFHDGHVEKTDDRRLREVMNSSEVRLGVLYPQTSTPHAANSSGESSSSSSKGVARNRETSASGTRASGAQSSGFAALEGFFQSKTPLQPPAGGYSTADPSTAVNRTSEPAASGAPYVFAAVAKQTNQVASKKKSSDLMKTQAVTMEPSETRNSVTVIPLIEISTPERDSWWKWWLVLASVAIILGIVVGTRPRRRRRPRGEA